MPSTHHLLMCALVLSGCTLTQEPAPLTLPAPVPVPLVSDRPSGPYCPLDVIEVVRLSNAPTGGVPTFVAPATPKKGTRARSPLQIVTQGHKAARVEPSERGYHGANGEQVYSWTAGKVYTVYLSKAQGTGIFLPPGEKLVSGLFLDPDAYDVKVKRAGAGETAYDALMVRPLIDKGDVQAFLLTESGRRYLLHFSVGETGMLAVTFEGPPVGAQARAAAEPALVLPRPPQ